jgi:hypothetical protein
MGAQDQADVKHNYVKIPVELQRQLEADKLNIEKLKMDLKGTNEERMVTPDVVKQHAARQGAGAGLY